MRDGYYYGTQAVQFSFFMVPKILLSAPPFRGLSMEAKMLYCIAMDRMSLSAKNGWLDEKQRVYLDAAKIDGCSYFGAYRRIFLPLCKPAIISNAIMLFMATWNDYFGPMIFTHSEEKWTIQVAIAMLSSHYEQQTDIPLVMCASLIAVLPVLILFITCQKYFTDSFAMSGIKG